MSMRITEGLGTEGIPYQADVLIIGAGIGGLTAAIALRRAGYAVEVFERVQTLHEVGAGMTLWPNAVKALRKLGLQAFIDEHSLPATDSGIYTWQGRLLAQTARWHVVPPSYLEFAPNFATFH